MKFGKKALLSSSFFFTCFVYAGTGADVSNRPQYPRGVLNATIISSEQSLQRPSSDPATASPSSISHPTIAASSSSTTTASSQGSSNDSVSLDLPSQQDPSSKPTDSWPSELSTLKTRSRSRPQVFSNSSALPSTSSLSNPIASATAPNSSTSDGPFSTSQERPSGKTSSDKYGSTNNGTASLVPSRTKNGHPPWSTHASNHTITGTGTRPRSTYRNRVKAQTTVTMECPIGFDECYVVGEPKSADESVSTSTITRKCTLLFDEEEPMTIYSIVHTKTVTFYGNRTDYTPPYSTIKTPVYCLEFEESPASSTPEGDFPEVTQVAAGTTTDFFRSLTPFIRPKVTFITTDKNPSVVFPSDPPPNYSATWSDPYPNPVVHKSVPPQGDQGDQGDQGSLGRQGGLGRTPEGNNQPRPTFNVTAKGNEVIINSEIYSSLKPDQTTTVSVDGGKFTIYPTAIVGLGGTVAKPAPSPTKFGVPSPTNGTVGGLDVSLSGSQVAIGGVTMTMPPHGTTTNIQGQSVTISANQIIVGTRSFKFNPVQALPESEVIVAGGEMLTVAGKSVVVVHSKTITYGPDTPITTEVVEGDTVTIGPSGVRVHGLVLGSFQANETDTKYEIIGGATITKIAPSIAIINGDTFTVGPGSHLTTKVIAGQEFTLGPMGVIVSTITLSYPFGSTVITTIALTGTWLNTLPIETSRSPKDDDDDSMSPSIRPSLSCAGVALCIAIGVLVFA